MRPLSLLLLIIGTVILIQEASALTSSPIGLSSWSNQYSGAYPGYMSGRYGIYAGGAYQHYYTHSGSNREELHRMQVQSLRNRYPHGISRTHTPTRYSPRYSPRYTPRYTRNYYTTDNPSRSGMYGGYGARYPPTRSFWGHSYY